MLRPLSTQIVVDDLEIEAAKVNICTKRKGKKIKSKLPILLSAILAYYHNNILPLCSAPIEKKVWKMEGESNENLL